MGLRLFRLAPDSRADDLSALQSIAEVQISPDGSRIAYSVRHSDRPGRPYSQVFIMDVASGKSVRLGTDRDGASNPRWSPDGEQIAYLGRGESGSGIIIARPDGTLAVPLAPVGGTNHPLPSGGERMAWSPDARQIAFISATPGPETENANGDPMVITRYLYKPTASEGSTRFNDNKRLHIFIVDVASKQVRQLTTGDYYEHSIDWSPSGDELLFVSNREPDPDRFFNYDIFAVKVADGGIRPLTRTRSAEYRPSWSPDGRSDRIPRHQARSDLLGDHDGRHARVGDGRERRKPAGDRGRNRQSPGAAPVDARRPRPVLHRPGRADRCDSIALP